MTTDIISDLMDMKLAAEKGPIGKRRSSFDLYELLGRVMDAAHRCRDPKEYQKVRDLVVGRGSNGNRVFVEHGSDEYILICRYVFADPANPATERSNASRYASAMRMADKAGVPPHKLFGYLKDNGGIDRLYKNRPGQSRTVSRKALRLNQPVTVTMGKTYSLIVKFNNDDTFDVLTVNEHGTPDHEDTEKRPPLSQGHAERDAEARHRLQETERNVRRGEGHDAALGDREAQQPEGSDSRQGGTVFERTRN